MTLSRSGIPLPPPPPAPKATTTPPPSTPMPKPTDIVTIPERFYGLAVKMEPPFETDEKEKPVIPAPPVPPSPAPLVTPPMQPGHASSAWMIGLIVVVVLLIGGGWIYWNRAALFGPKPAPIVAVKLPVPPNAPIQIQARSPSAGAVSVSWQDQSSTETGFQVERRTNAEFAVVQTLPANSSVFLDTSAEPGVTTTYRVIAFNDGGKAPPSEEVQVFVTALPPAPPPAPTLPPDGLDSDSDGLTDTEEVVYGANPRLPDSDGDGYLDGNEVFNLYSPIERAPTSFLKSTLVKTASSTIGWQLLIPAAWQQDTSVSPAVTQWSAPSGERFVLTVEENPEKKTATDWYLAQHPGALETQLIQVSSNKYGVKITLSPDRMTGYVAWKDKILSIAYQLNDQSFVNLRTTFGMMLNSLRLSDSPALPDLSKPVAIPPAFSREGSTATSTAGSTAIQENVSTSTTVSTSSRP